MRKVLAFVVILSMVLALSGCALSELLHMNDDVVDMGGGEASVKWNLVHNNNAYSTVQSAYFEFAGDTFRYYEDGVLKKEGTHKVTYSGVDNALNPLVIVLNFGEDETGLSIFDYLQCYTEDTKDQLHQFTVMSEGYHIEPLRSGGVPVRDYHLSDMPYAFGTYVKESTEPYTYQNGKADYLGCSKLDGTFCDELGNLFYFSNNSYSSKPESSYYTVYMRYENHANGTAIEGTISLSWYEDWDTGERHDVALIYVTHGDGEPAAQSGVSVEADYELMDFVFSEDGSFSFTCGEYFAENPECEYDPANFIGATYHKVTEKQ
ncbi:MAG: hypothetical protein IJV96_04280 [Clostridia bacterium]|nr:hypothetical protein [Clostridia bacterium]